MTTPEFRTEFVEQITRFFGERLDELSTRERAHAAAVVGNTVVTLAFNQGNVFSTEGISSTLQGLNPNVNAVIEALVFDDSIELLHDQSRRICTVIRGALSGEASC